MAIEISIAEREDEEEWNEFIENSPQGTIFHIWNFLKIVEKHSFSQLFPLMGYKGNKLIGVFPLFNKKIFLYNFVYSPPPSTSLLYMGPVISLDVNIKRHKREKDYMEFIKAVNFFLKTDLKASYSYISLPPNSNDPRPFQWEGYEVSPLYDYSIDLSDGLECQLKKLSRTLRESIHSTKSKDIIIEQGNKSDLKVIHSLMDQRYNRQNKKLSVTLQYFLELYESFNKNMCIFVVKYNEEPISGVIGIIYKNEFFNWFGFPKYNVSINPSPNDMLVWEEIKYCCQKNINTLTIMGAAGHARLHEYYSLKFNPFLKVRFSTKKASPFIKLLIATHNKLFND